MLLSQKISLQRFLKIRIKQGTLGDQWVNSFLGNFPRDSVDKKGILDRVELREHWIHFVVWSMEDLHVDVNELVHLEDAEDIEVFVDEE